MTPRPAEESILRTLLYADVFDYPLTPAEVHHYLIGHSASREEVQRALTASAWLTPRLTRVNGYFAVRQREALGPLRDSRAGNSARLWPLARRWGCRLGCLPFVRMVAVTGALAVDNSPPGDDLDFLVVTAPGRVWLARAFCIALVRAARLVGVGLCPNYVLARTALPQAQRDLFAAHDLLQMVPLLGFGLYEEMRAVNRWADHMLPHAYQPLHREPELRPRAWLRLLQRVGEALLAGRLGDALERWERERKLRKFAALARAPGSSAVLDAEHVKGHFHDHGQTVLREFEARLTRYLSEAQP